MIQNFVLSHYDAEIILRALAKEREAFILANSHLSYDEIELLIAENISIASRLEFSIKHPYSVWINKDISCEKGGVANV